jgi:hypothetical protein
MQLVLVFVALGSAAAVVRGPLGLGAIQWRLTPTLLNQTYGADGAQLVLDRRSARGAPSPPEPPTGWPRS